MKAPTIRAPTGGTSRRVFRWVGLFILLLNVGILAAFGVESLTHVDVVVPSLLGVLSGLVLVVSSVDLPLGVEWYRVAGLGYVILASGILSTALLGGNEPWGITVALLNALVLAFVGIDVARGGRHFDVEA